MLEQVYLSVQFTLPVLLYRIKPLASYKKQYTTPFLLCGDNF